MRVIGFNFKKISAERKKEIQGKLELKSNLAITEIEKETLDLAGEILKFSYSFTIKYDPDFAEISFKGTVLAIPDQPEGIKKILKEWKNKKISEDTRIPIYNFIMSKCNIKALQLEEEFALPTHIPLPHLTKPKSKEPTNYTG